MTLRIAMWSGPRNLSTAMMRSFGARADTVVSDEPFYGAYLRHTGDDQPMKDAVMASMDCDWASIARAQNGAPPEDRPIWYQKQMAHHMEGPVGIADLGSHTHAFLIRDPRRVVASYAAKRVQVRPEHLGVARQRDYFDREADRLGQAPPIVDSADILANPAATLAALCAALGIAFDAAMLHWPAGRRATDGVWAAHWYNAVEASTGFGPPDAGIVTLDAEAEAVAAACAPHYAYLAAHRLHLSNRSKAMTGKTAIIIGASRGIGLALAGELATRGWQVTATARGDAPELAALAAASGGHVTLATVDIDDVDSCAALDVALTGQDFDLIFVNAGTYGPAHQSVEQVSAAEMGALMMTNAIAPIRLAKRLLPKARAGGTIAVMSSILGSVALNDMGTTALYRASKAGLNIIARGFYIEDVKPRGLTLLNLHPGWVKTDMGGPQAPVEIADSVRGLADVLAANTGGGHHYLDYQGNVLPW